MTYKPIADQYKEARSTIIILFYWSMKARQASTSIKRVMDQVLRRRVDKWSRTRFRSGRTRDVNRLEQHKHTLNVHLGDLKEFMEVLPGLSEHAHVKYVIEVAEGVLEDLRLDLNMIREVSRIVDDAVIEG